jgi:hypothetical protein
VPTAKLAVVYKVAVTAKRNPYRVPKRAIFEVFFITPSFNEF